MRRTGCGVELSTNTEADCEFENRRDTAISKHRDRGLIYMENDRQVKGNKRSKGISKYNGCGVE